MSRLILVLITFLFILNNTVVLSQNNDDTKKEGLNLKDTLDGKLDASKYLAEANGFIPVPSIVTEQALGGIGIALAAVFIKPNKYKSENGKYVPPNITAGFGAYTANQTWAVGGVRLASLPKYGLKYKVGMIYTNLNLDFYRTLPNDRETSFSFNFKTLPIFASLLKEVKKNSNLFIGLEYIYLYSKISPQFNLDNTPDFLENFDYSSQLGYLGLVLDYDSRDNIFTPNTGLRILSKISFNDNWTGSDYEFQNLRITLNKYFQFTSNWISGFRLDTRFLFGEAPFYALPSIELRGVPLARYQGSSIYVFESEQRYDFSLRWSGILFGGLAKASTDSVNFSDATLVYNYGAGFRYLLARLFKLRVGIDIAKSNDDWGYYITFGSAW